MITFILFDNRFFTEEMIKEIKNKMPDNGFFLLGV